MKKQLKNCVKLFDTMNLIEQKLNDYCALITEMQPYIKTYKVKKIADLVIATILFKQEYEKFI